MDHFKRARELFKEDPTEVKKLDVWVSKCRIELAESSVGSINDFAYIRSGLQPTSKIADFSSLKSDYYQNDAALFVTIKRPTESEVGIDFESDFVQISIGETGYPIELYDQIDTTDSS